MDVQIDTAIKRARGYWFVDGFTEMAAGGLFVLLAGLLLPIFGLLAASLLIASAGSVLSSMPAWFPVGLGLVWAALCVLAGEWMGLRRFRLVGALILLAGMTVGTWQLLLGLPTLPANVQPGILQPPVLESINRTLASLAFLTLASGVILLFSGLVTFLRYRKENPIPYTEGL